jgi:hypothetical protein
MSKANSKRLEAKARKLRRTLKGLADDRVWSQLIPIWRRPGWTTPAEFMLVDGALDGLQAQAEVLAGLRNVVLQGSRAVRPG